MFAEKTKIVLASSNAGKVREFNARLAQLKWQIVPQSDLDIAPAAETAVSFVENAIAKARHAAHYSGLPALADDSGLSVPALRGAPGIYSARYSGEHASDAANVEKLLGEMRDIENRNAWFYCALVLLRHAEDPTPLIATGCWRGRIAHAPCGAGGFGYDPVFFVPEHACTAAELEAAVKNRISHRGRAVDALLAQIHDA